MYRHRPVEFRRESSKENVDSVTIESNAAAFYKDLIKKHVRVTPSEGDEPASNRQECRVCRSTTSDPKHHLSVVHQMNHATVEAPVEPLPVEQEHVGYKYLVKHGWSPISKAGLGPTGREGKRLPIKVGSVKKDKLGVGRVEEGREKDGREKRDRHRKEPVMPMTAREARRLELLKRQKHDRLMNALR